MNRLLLAACLSLLVPLQVFGFGRVTLSKPTFETVDKPNAGAIDSDGGTERPEPRMLLRVDEPMSLAANRVFVRVQDQVAVVKVHHVLQNNTDRILQARYVMPLGEQAHMTGYAIWEKREKLTGELMDVRQAERLYTRVTQQVLTSRPEVAQEVQRVQVARDPGILRQMAPDFFETHVYPIFPYSLKQVEFLYSETVQSEGGWCEWRFPLTAAGVFKNPVGGVLVELSLGDSAGIRAVECDYPGATIERADGTVNVRIAGRMVEPTRDVVVRWQTGLEPLAAAVLAHRVDDEAGYGLVRIALEGSHNVDQPLDVVLLADASRSIHGDKASRQRAALDGLASALRVGDRVAVVRFAGHAVTSLPLQDWTASTPGLVQDALGGAEIGSRTRLRPALEAGFEAFGALKPGRARLLVFATDAVTEEDPAEVLGLEPTGAQVLAIGTGHDDDADLLGRLVDRHGGMAWIPGAGVWRVLYPSREPTLLQETYGEKIVGGSEIDPSPLLASFRSKRITTILEDPAGNLESILPVIPTSSWAGGGTATYVFRYREPGSAPVQFSAWVDGVRVDRQLELDLPQAEPLNRFVASFWGRAQAAHLLRLEPLGSDDPNRDEVVRLSLAHRFVTPYTAFLSLPDAERRRMLLGPMPPDDGEDMYSFSKSAGGAPEAEVWILILSGIAFALFWTRRRRQDQIPQVRLAL